MSAALRGVTTVIGAHLFLFGLSGGAADWPRFRGPNGSGVSEAHDLPVEFGPGKNVWKVNVPAGSSSPVIASNRVWLGEGCYATPALTEKQILVRSKHVLWAFCGK